MRVLVTGATGFIGRSLAARLVNEEGTAVTALIREHHAHRTLPDSLEANRSKINFIYADLRDFQQTKLAVWEVQPDIIFHLAAAGVSDPFLPVNTALDHNLFGTLNLLRAAFEGGAEAPRPQQLIIGRTPGEYSGMNHYAASKAAAWQFCRMYARTQGWPLIGVMIFQAYGPDQPEQRLLPSAMRAALAGQDFPMTVGRQKRDWIHLIDVVEGLLAIQKAGLAPGTTVDLGSGELHTVASVVHRVYMLAGGKGRPLFGAVPSRPGEVAAQQADVYRTQALTDWKSTVSLEDGLSQVLESLRL
ncbi:MAG: SDR family NAD(P)-dependent oxidoreductase [Chloroflexi bacterium]|jgi:nucleoside-diphosphate-sugar epimerase|nr:SDR family NAD(P)-dependent oxidoreductase [Chloroflexota bacterium]